MTPRVLFINHLGALGGAELAILPVAEAYRQNSTVLLFADGPFRERLTRQGNRVIIMQAGQGMLRVRRESSCPGLWAVLGVLTLTIRVAKMARRHDVIYANSQKAFIVGALAGVLARRPVIWDLNDLLTREHFSATNLRVSVTIANRCATKVIANSIATANSFIQQRGRKDKVAVVYNGIAPEPFHLVSSEQVERIRNRLRLGKAPVVGVFGRLGPWKGQHVALDAMARLDGVHLLIVGSPLFGQEEYAQGLRAQATRLGIAERVHFLGFREDVPALMRLSQVIVHTSTSPEPFGNVIVEGMLAGRPVVATAGGGVTEIIDSERIGVLVPPSDSAAIAAAVAALLADPARAASIGEAGRLAVTARFRVDSMVESVAKHIRLALG